ncbi:MAG TPA: MFS transporter [Ktedonobacterales bacterium]
MANPQPLEDENTPTDAADVSYEHDSERREGVASSRLAHAAVPQSGPLTDKSAEAAKGTRGFRTVLGNRYFLRLWLAQLISQTIMNAANYGLIVLVANQTKSVTATGAAIVAFSLPAALFGAPAGVVVDRFDRRRVLWISNALRGLASIGFVISLFISHTAFVPVLLLSFFTAAVGQFFAPAEGAAIPQLVHREELMSALSLFNITFWLAQGLGLIGLGPAILLFVPDMHIGQPGQGFDLLSVQVLFLLIAVGYAICMLLILSIPARRLRMHSVTGEEPVPHAPKGAQLSGIWHSIVESWRFILADRRLANAVFQLCLVGTATSVIATMAPTFVKVFFNQPENHAALVFFPAGVGLVLGSAFTPTIARWLRYRRTVAAGVLLLAGCMALLTLARALAQRIQPEAWWTSFPYLAVAIVLMFLVGVSLDFINVPAQTRMQERSPDRLKGRVIALQAMLFNASTVPAVLIFGRVADTYGLAVAIDALAAIIAATGLASVYFGSRIGREGLQSQSTK